MNKKVKSYWFGIFAEYYVIFVFFFCGYILLVRRYKTNIGEIDLIFKKGKSIVAVEVKARKDKNIDVEGIVNYSQFFRIVNGLRIFLNKNEMYSNFNIRIDVVLVYRNLRLKHIKNVWTE